MHKAFTSTKLKGIKIQTEININYTNKEFITACFILQDGKSIKEINKCHCHSMYERSGLNYTYSYIITNNKNKVGTTVNELFIGGCQYTKNLHNHKQLRATISEDLTHN